MLDQKSDPDVEDTKGKSTPVVFIAGCSHSGSTLLGLVLGSDRRGFFAGEIKQFKLRSELSRERNERGRCTCGEWPDLCEFWSQVYENHPPEMDLHPSPGISWQNVRATLRALRASTVVDAALCEEYANVCEAIFNEALTLDGNVAYVVDSSKSLRSLQYLTAAPAIDLRVVHLVRDGESVAASYRRRGKSALAGIVSWAYSTWAVSAFLRRGDTPWMVVRYEDLCNSSASEIERLNRFLGTEISLDHVDDQVRSSRYHVLAGSKVKRQTNEFRLSRSENEGANLPVFSRAIAALVVRPLNRAIAADRKQDQNDLTEEC